MWLIEFNTDSILKADAMLWDGKGQFPVPRSSVVFIQDMSDGDNTPMVGAMARAFVSTHFKD